MTSDHSQLRAAFDQVSAELSGRGLARVLALAVRSGVCLPADANSEVATSLMRAAHAEREPGQSLPALADRIYDKVLLDSDVPVASRDVVANAILHAVPGAPPDPSALVRGLWVEGPASVPGRAWEQRLDVILTKDDIQSLRLRIQSDVQRLLGRQRPTWDAAVAVAHEVGKLLALLWGERACLLKVASDLCRSLVDQQPTSRSADALLIDAVALARMALGQASRAAVCARLHRADQHVEAQFGGNSDGESEADDDEPPPIVLDAEGNRLGAARGGRVYGVEAVRGESVRRVAGRAAAAFVFAPSPPQRCMAEAVGRVARTIGCLTVALVAEASKDATQHSDRDALRPNPGEMPVSCVTRVHDVVQLPPPPHEEHGGLDAFLPPLTIVETCTTRRTFDRHPEGRRHSEPGTPRWSVTAHTVVYHARDAWPESRLVREVHWGVIAQSGGLHLSQELDRSAVTSRRVPVRSTRLGPCPADAEALRQDWESADSGRPWVVTHAYGANGMPCGSSAWPLDLFSGCYAAPIVGQALTQAIRPARLTNECAVVGAAASVALAHHLQWAAGLLDQAREAQSQATKASQKQQPRGVELSASAEASIQAAAALRSVQDLFAAEGAYMDGEHLAKRIAGMGAALSHACRLPLRMSCAGVNRRVEAGQHPSVAVGNAVVHRPGEAHLPGRCLYLGLVVGRRPARHAGVDPEAEVGFLMGKAVNWPRRMAAYYQKGLRVIDPDAFAADPPALYRRLAEMSALMDNQRRRGQDPTWAYIPLCVATVPPAEELDCAERAFLAMRRLIRGDLAAHRDELGDVDIGHKPHLFDGAKYEYIGTSTVDCTLAVLRRIAGGSGWEELCTLGAFDAHAATTLFSSPAAYCMNRAMPPLLCAVLPPYADPRESLWGLQSHQQAHASEAMKASAEPSRALRQASPWPHPTFAPGMGDCRVLASLLQALAPTFPVHLDKDTGAQVHYEDLPPSHPACPPSTHVHGTDEAVRGPDKAAMVARRFLVDAATKGLCARRDTPAADLRWWRRESGGVVPRHGPPPDAGIPLFSLADATYAGRFASLKGEGRLGNCG